MEEQSRVRSTMLKPKSDQKGLRSGTQRTQQGPGMGCRGDGGKSGLKDRGLFVLNLKEATIN